VTCHCEATDRHFGAERAESDLVAYRRRGPTGTARRLLRLVRELGIQPETLLDVGAGIGVLHHELLAGGAGTAVHVDAAGSYIRTAQAEAGRRGISTGCASCTVIFWLSHRRSHPPTF